MINPITELDTYKYSFTDVSLTSTNLKDPIEIMLIKSFSITHDYENAISPFILVTVGFTPSEYNKIITNMDTLRFKMRIMKVIVTGNDITSQPKVFMNIDCKATTKDNINTYTSDVLSNYEKNNNNIDMDNINNQISELTLFLYDDTAIYKYRKCMSYITNGGMNDVVYHLLVDRGFKNILMSNTADNKYDEYIIPYGNLGENLSHLNKYWGIYKQNYLFYMDLNTVYIIDMSDVGTVLSNNEYGSVNIYLENLTDDVTTRPGSYTDNVNRLYVLNGINFDIQDNDSTIEYYSAGKITSVNHGGKIVTNNQFGTSDVERAYVFDNDHEVNQIISTIKEDKKLITMELSYVDLNILTPNKIYNIIVDEEYGKKYDLNGGYRLSSQALVFVTDTDDTVKVTTQINLKKVK